MNTQSSTTKAARLASRLRRGILADGLQPGDPMPSEGELMELHGLSRASVREALRILDVEGFVEVRVGRSGGVVVAHPDPDRLGEWLATQLTLRAVTVQTLVEFRVMVEPVAAQIAAERATHEDLKLMHDILEAETAEEELDFHLFVADATHNELLRLLLSAVHGGLQDHDIYASAATPEDAELGRRQHRQVFEAISNRNGEEAAALMRRHLKGVEKVVKRTGRAHDVLIPPDAWRDRDHLGRG